MARRTKRRRRAAPAAPRADVIRELRATMQIVVDGVACNVPIESYSGIERSVAPPLPRNARGGYSFSVDLEARAVRTPAPDEPDAWLDIASDDDHPFADMIEALNRAADRAGRPHVARVPVDSGTLLGAFASASPIGRHLALASQRDGYERPRVRGRDPRALSRAGNHPRHPALGGRAPRARRAWSTRHARAGSPRGRARSREPRFSLACLAAPYPTVVHPCSVRRRAPMEHHG